MSSNNSVIADNAGEYDDWIEIYNGSASSFDLNGYFISDNPDNLEKYQFSSSLVVPAGGFILIWADEDQPQGNNHVNFKLSSSGEQVILTNPNGVTVIDEVFIPALASDQSYGRMSDGGTTLEIFQISSPSASNSNGQALVSAPVLSLPCGIYTGSQTIQLSSEPNTSIYYTVDGTDPDLSSQLYTGSFTINSTSSIKAIAVDQQNNISTVSLGSYILDPTTDLSIMHVIIDTFYLYDDSLGMYVIGTNGVQGPCHDDPRNWSQDWQYRADVLLYEKDGTLAFKEGCGLEISGACSRNSPKKSFNVKFKSEYGATKIDYKLFETKDATDWDGFKIRGASWGTQYRAYDNLNHILIENELDVDHQSSRSVALYLNNKYWGLYFIRDRMNGGYVNTHHPKVDADNIDLIKLPFGGDRWHWIEEEVKEGTNDAYYALDEFMVQNPLSNQANYDYVKTKIDVNSFLDYFVAQSFYKTGDWPGNNLKTWRPRTADGKWRWMLFDVESSHWNGGAGNTQYLSWIVNANGAIGQYDSIYTQPFRLMLTNNEFKHEFIQRTNTYMHTLWDTTRVLSVVNDIKNDIGTEIQQDYDRWKPEIDNSWDYLAWDTLYNNLYDFFVLRPDSMRASIDYALNTSGRINLSFNTTPSTNGKVHLHTNYFELPNAYQGTYHANVPLDIHAIPNPGYRFSHWQETGNTNPNLYQSFTTNTTLTPIFVSAQDLVINEIHYNPIGSSESPEFIEIYNPDTHSKALDAYEFANGICFEFPAGSTIGPGEYIIIANDASLYIGNGYQVFQWEDSKLDNNGERLHLVNRNAQIIDSLRYNDGGDWISTADNGFYSLALLAPNLDNSQAGSWDVQSVYITPGAANQFLPFDTYHQGSPIVFNELHYHPYDSITPSGDTISSRNYEFIELKNLSNTAYDLTGHALSRGVTFEFPVGSSIPANGFIVLAEDSTHFVERYGFSAFGRYSGKLSNNGELVWLSDENGGLLDAVRYSNTFPWDTQAAGGSKDYSLALIDGNVNNDTRLNWKVQCTSIYTPGAENDFACFTGLDYTGLMINELFYNPAIGSNYEFIEITNHSNIPMDMNGVSFSQGVFYNFEPLYLPGVPAAPNNSIVIARDSASFHNAYGYAPHGTYIGVLSNSGETVMMQDLFGKIIDEVTYDDVLPWDPIADQGSKSLALISGSLDNSLASSWCTQDVNVSPKAPNTFNDVDADGVVDCQDQCPGQDDGDIGSACDDGDPCTTGETYDGFCNCSGGQFQDTDNDGVCDVYDECAGHDDNIDSNNNGIPDGCEDCVDEVLEMSQVIIDTDTAANLRIITNGKVSNGYIIDYHAAQSVELLPEFEVEIGAIFHAYIEPCN